MIRLKRQNITPVLTLINGLYFLPKYWKLFELINTNKAYIKRMDLFTWLSYLPGCHVYNFYNFFIFTRVSFALVNDNNKQAMLIFERCQYR